MLNKEFDISKPYDLFSLIYGFLMHDKTKDVKIIDPINYRDGSLFHVIIEKEDKNECLDLCICDSEGIKFDYIKHLPNIENAVTNKDLFQYLYYFGKILGRFTFYHIFNRKKELWFNEKDYNQTKTAFDMMFESLNIFIEKHESLNGLKHFIEIDNGFLEMMNEIYNSSENSSINIPVHILMGMSYISLSYTLTGLIGLRNDERQIASYQDLLTSLASDVNIEEKLENLLISPSLTLEDQTKIEALLLCFKVVSDFYSHSSIYGDIIENNITYKALYQLGRYVSFNVKTKISDGSTLRSVERRNWCIKAISIVANSALTINDFCMEESIIEFFNFSNYLSVNENLSYLNHDCNVPTIYLETFVKMLYTPLIQGDENKSNDLFKLSNFSCSILSEDQIRLKDKEEKIKISFKIWKNYVEKLLHSDSPTIVSPHQIFELTYKLSFARLYLYDRSLLKSYEILDDEYVVEFITIGEIAIYYLFQEWFNRKDKVYKFEKRSYLIESDKQLTYYDPLKFEIIIILTDYLRMIFTFHNDYQSDMNLFNTNDLTYVLNNEFHLNDNFIREKIMKQVHTLSKNLQGMIKNEKYGIDMIIEAEKGKIGLVFLLLAFIDKDIIIDILMNKTKIVDFIEQLRDEDNKNLILQILEKLKCKEDILGYNLDDSIYCKINTCVKEIFDAPLNVYQKFYLIYCLNYQYIREFNSQFIANELSPNESKNLIILNRKAYFDNEEKILHSLEDVKNEVFKITEKQNKSTYGFEL